MRCPSCNGRGKHTEVCDSLGETFDTCALCGGKGYVSKERGEGWLLGRRRSGCLVFLCLLACSGAAAVLCLV